MIKIREIPRIIKASLITQISYNVRKPYKSNPSPALSHTYQTATRPQIKTSEIEMMKKDEEIE